jgi:hypothetical protein
LRLEIVARGLPLNSFFHIVNFEETDQRAAFVAALSRFLNYPQGSTFIEREPKAQVWGQSSNLKLFLNDLALEAAMAAFGSIPVIDRCPNHALPVDCTLLIDGGQTPSMGLDAARQRLQD